RTTTRLATVFSDIENNAIWNNPEETTPVVLQMLENGRDTEIKDITQIQVQEVKERLLAGLDDIKAEWDQRERRLDQVRREQRRAILQGAVQLKLERAKQRLSTLQERNAAEFPMRMAQAQLEKAEREIAKTLEPETTVSDAGIGPILE
ncbi:hypothetical protein, partial [Bradyrhizobium sp. NBAIM08]|uniref:hypothetical protein n=1 Tax=Bradyrhizobium sp. NBAIM08 TaxID=2793815 RepID=UPI001CD22F01